MNKAKLINTLFWAGLLVAGLSHLRNHFIDYPVFELAGQKILRGEIHHLYDLNKNTPGGFYYSYFFGLFFSFLSLLGSTPGRYIYLLSFLFCYWYILRFSVRAATKITSNTLFKPVFLQNLLILLTLYSFNDALMTANVGILLLFLCILAFQWREKSWVSGLFLAMAIVFKIYPALLLGFFVWGRRWSQVAWCFLWALVLWIFLPIIIYGPSVGRQLVENQFFVVSHFGEHWSFGSHVFQNLPSTAIRLGSLFGLHESTCFRFSIFAGLLCLIAFFLPTFISREKRFDARIETKMFVLVLAFVPIITPVSWYNMGLFYSPLLAVLLLRSLEKKGYRNWFFLGAYVLFYCLMTPDIVGRPLNQRLAWLGLPFLGITLALLGYLRTEGPFFSRIQTVQGSKRFDS